MKFWSLANLLTLASFHVEMMVEQMWRSYKADEHTHPWIVADTLKALPNWIDKAVYDPLEPGGRIDAYLSTEDRSKACVRAESDAARAAKAENERLVNKSERGAIDLWREVYLSNVAFPAHG